MLKAHCNFFFSSRRRHTRWPRDWSSDVCSSDIPRHAVNPSLGARVQHPCCTRSGNVCRALRCAKLEYLKDKRDKNVLEDYTRGDRKRTRLNSSHVAISYADFCLKRKNKRLCKY